MRSSIKLGLMVLWIAIAAIFSVIAGLVSMNASLSRDYSGFVLIFTLGSFIALQCDKWAVGYETPVVFLICASLSLAVAVVSVISPTGLVLAGFLTTAVVLRAMLVPI